MVQEGTQRYAGGGITPGMGGLKKTFPAQGGGDYMRVQDYYTRDPLDCLCGEQ